MLDGIPTRLFPTTLPTDTVYLYKMELLGTFLGAIAFGMITVLLISTVQVLLGNSCIYPKHMRTGLLYYVIFMFSLALVACVQQISFAIQSATPQQPDVTGSLVPRSQLRQTYVLPFSIWGTDAFLIWRCTLLYRGVSRMWTVALFFVVFIAALCSLGSGILFFFTERFISSKYYSLSTIFPVASSGLVNIILRAVIVGRILYHQHYIRKAMGSHYASIYTKIISMCVESCFMTSICGAVFLGLYFSNDPRQELASVVPLILLPHTCVITPLLLVYRAAKGMGITELALSGPVTSSGITTSDEDRAEMEFKSHSNTGSIGGLSSFSTRRTSSGRIE